MRTSLKTRTFMLLVAALLTTMALALPQPAQACLLYPAEDCYYPNGVYCISSYCRTWCNGQPEGYPSCYYAGDDCC